MVDEWLVSHSLPSAGASAISSGETDTISASGQQQLLGSGKTGSGIATPVRKISAHEFKIFDDLKINSKLFYIQPSCLVHQEY